MTKLQCGKFCLPTECHHLSPNPRGWDLIPTPQQVFGFLRISLLPVYTFFPRSGEARAWTTRVHCTLKRWLSRDWQQLWLVHMFKHGRPQEVKPSYYCLLPEILFCLAMDFIFYIYIHRIDAVGDSP
jgi:hypothetical protein